MNRRVGYAIQLAFRNWRDWHAALRAHAAFVGAKVIAAPNAQSPLRPDPYPPPSNPDQHRHRECDTAQSKQSDVL